MPPRPRLFLVVPCLVGLTPLFVACTAPSTDRPRPPTATTAPPVDSSSNLAAPSASSNEPPTVASSAAASAVASTSASASPVAPGKRHYIVAAMGDSLTDAKSQGGKFLDLLEARCPRSRFDNFGKGGQMVNQMRKRFAHDILGEGATDGEPPTYSHVIVFGGVNDLCSDLTAKRSVPKIEQDLSTMYRLAHEHSIKVIAVTVAPWGDFTKFYNPSRAATTQQLNRWILSTPSRGEADSVIDAYSLLSCGDPEKLCPSYIPPFKDGLHFNKDAHRKLGEALFTQVFSDCE